MIKHEMVSCERCSARIECRANSFTKCHCSEVYLTQDEMEYLNEKYEGCLCNSCLNDLKKEYHKGMML